MHNSRSSLSLSEKDNKKAIFERIQNVENNFGDLCTELSKFTKKKARLRDKYDELGRLFKVVADNDEFNETMAEGLINYSKVMVLLADIKDIEVQRLQAKLVRELAGYESICKNVKESVKHAIALREKELTRKNQLEQIKQRTNKNKGGDSGDTESSRSKSEQRKTNCEVEEIVLKFEQQKLDDLRRMLLDFTLIQLKEHVKCVEILSAAYQDVAEIDVEKDLQEFNDKFLMNDDKMLKNGLRSQSMGALSSLFNPNSQQPEASKRNLSSSTHSLDTADKDNGRNNQKGKRCDSEASDTMSESEDDDGSTSEESDQSVDEDADNDVDDDGTRKRREKDSNEEDDEDVVVANNEKTDKKRISHNGNVANQSKSGSAPVPHVRFSKLLQQNTGH